MFRCQVNDTVYGMPLMQLPISTTVRGVGRPPLNIRPITVRLSSEVLKRIEALVGPRRIAEFIREAVERELKRREKKI
jgi:hypothetical protein